jgi:toxin YhaV
MIVRNWTLMAHPCFSEQVKVLETLVASLKVKEPDTYLRKNATKRLGRIIELVCETIPEDPGAEVFRLGNTLGPSRRHWFRAKFYQQYRLFYRFDSQARVIIYAWVNDEDTKRAYDSKTDVYGVFARMLNGGNPPDDFDTLLAEAQVLVSPRL